MANETARQAAELSRATAETNRASAESARATAETTRTNAESARMSAEAARETAEGTRASSETARAAAETARAAAETAREAAEAARESASAAAVQEAEDAADTANAAAEAVSGQISEIKSQLKVLGANSFTKASGSVHSATADKATGLSIASGEKFCIMYSRPTTNWTYFYGYDSSGNQVGGGSLLSTNLSEGFNIITAPGDIASIGWADSSTTTSGIYKFSVVAYNSVFSEANEALQLANYVVPIVDSYCYSKNIIGPEPGVLYPCDILPNTALVMSTADGSNIATNNTYINFYDANKTRIKGFNFYNGNSSRAFTYDGATTAKYVAFTGNQYPLQLERGSIKTAYQTYFSSADNLSRIVNAGYINYLLSSADVVAATLINGVPSPNTSRIYSREFNVGAGDYISFDNSSNTKLRYTIVYYKADGTFDSQTEWRAESVPNVIFTESKKIRILIGTSDYSAISDVESAANSIAVHISEVNQLRLIYGETAYVKPADDIDPKLQEFSAKYIGAGAATSFVFFTDPHILSAGGKSAFYDKLHAYTRKINDYYSQLSTSFVLCGGDWLEWNDTPADALWKLNLMQGRVRELFGERYYPAFGNHDNNYQGTEEADVKTLSRQIIRDVMFPYWPNTYYTFAMPEARFYVLDSGTDWNQSMDVDDRWTQIGWLAGQLTENDDPHSAIFMHILWNSSSATGIAQFADNVQQLVGAYNNHSTITLDGVSYDFTGCTGKVGFILGGHLHNDKSDTTTYSVPVIATINTQAGGGSFDLVIADWTNGKLYMVRIGSGDNRTFNIVI